MNKVPTTEELREQQAKMKAELGPYRRRNKGTHGPKVKENGTLHAKAIDTLSKQEKKALILEALAKEGYTPYQSARLLGVSDQYAYRIDAQVKSGVLAPLVRRAKKSIKSLLAGKPVGAMADVKGSDVLGAAKLVMERAEPPIQKIETKRTERYEFSLEERAKYEKMLGLEEPKQLEQGPDGVFKEPDKK